MTCALASTLFLPRSARVPGYRRAGPRRVTACSRTSSAGVPPTSQSPAAFPPEMRHPHPPGISCRGTTATTNAGSTPTNTCRLVPQDSYSRMTATGDYQLTGDTPFELLFAGRRASRVAPRWKRRPVTRLRAALGRPVGRVLYSGAPDGADALGMPSPLLPRFRQFSAFLSESRVDVLPFCPGNLPQRIHVIFLVTCCSPCLDARSVVGLSGL